MEQPTQTAEQAAHQATYQDPRQAASGTDAQPSAQAGAQSAFRPIYQPEPRAGDEPSGTWRKAQQRTDALLAKHPHAVMYGVIGLAVAVLILTIGLGATLLLAVLAGIGIAIGQYRDGDSRVRSAANRIMRRFS